MKKIFFFAAIAALALSSCSSDELVQAEQPVEDGAVVFSAYQGIATRGVSYGSDLTDVAALAAQGGFGVYAYEQNATLWDIYRTTNTMPNFFYNQQVTKGDFSTYRYSLKASLNETEYKALNETYRSTYYQDLTGEPLASAVVAAKSNVDFETFNGYPKDIKALGSLSTPDASALSSATWQYAPIKYFSNNENAKHSFFAYGPYNKDVNVVFSQATKGPAIRYKAGDQYDLVWANKVDVPKKDVNTTVDFTFAHALSKVSFKVSCFTDISHGSHGTGTALAEHTTVTVRSVKFVGVVPSQGLFSLYTGDWTLEASEEGAYEYAPSSPVVFDKNNTATTYLDFGSDIFVIPTKADQKLKVQVVYDVTTIDENNSSNSSTVTNVITSEQGYNLEKGTNYLFKLDLGLKSVQFNVTNISGWTAGSDVIVDLPNNKPVPSPSNRR